MPHHILVIGATGAVGKLFCPAALAAGHRLTIYTRSPAKLPESITSREDVNVLVGELDDPSGVQKAAQSGADVFVSVAGPVFPFQRTSIYDGMKLIIPQLIENHFQRALILSTPSYSAPEDGSALKWNLLVSWLKLVANGARQEVSDMGDFMATQPIDKLKWTLFRVAFLTNGEEAGVKAGFIAHDVSNMSISRKSIVKWVLDAIPDDQWAGKSPIIAN